MKIVEVLMPFHMNATNTDHKPGDTIEVSEAQLAKIRAVNVNMVSVLENVKTNTKKRAVKPHNGECTAQS